MPDRRRALLDTSVVIDLARIDADRLPGQSAIAAVTLAELAAGPHAARDHAERARRQDRLQWAATTWNPLPFDADAGRAYGRVFAAVRAARRSPRPRVSDLLVAATAVAHGLPSVHPKPARFHRTRRHRRSGLDLNHGASSGRHRSVTDRAPARRK